MSRQSTTAFLSAVGGALSLAAGDDAGAAVLQAEADQAPHNGRVALKGPQQPPAPHAVHLGNHTVGSIG
jgi:hypothetical protein